MIKKKNTLKQKGLVEDVYELPSIERTAYHEAGHALMAFLHERKFEYVTIIPEGKSAGHLAYISDEEENRDYHSYKFDYKKGFKPWGFGRKYDVLIKSEIRDFVEQQMLIRAAGCIAEAIQAGDPITLYVCIWVFSQDAIEFAELAKTVTGSEEECKTYQSWMLERAWNLMTVSSHRRAVEKLAKRLIMKKTVKYNEVCKIFKSSFAVDFNDVLRDRMKQFVSTSEVK